MPWVSKAQMRKFGVLLREGKITQEQYDEWKNSTPNIKKLPERVKKPKKSGFAKGFSKVALDLSAEALAQSGVPMQDAVPGTSLRQSAETAQSRGGISRTVGNDKQYRAALKTKYDTSRYGRRYHVS